MVAALALVAAACGDDDAVDSNFKFGMILVGPQNDQGWSQAHYEAGQYVLEQLGLPEEAMIVLDKVNVADRPETSVESVVADMIGQGAQIVFATSDDMRDGIEAAAAAHPEVPMIWSSGDTSWDEGLNYKPELDNLGTTMGRMYFGKFIAGCAAGLTTQTGSIGYVGPLINDETRRLVNSVYLGAEYCYTEYRGMHPGSLEFEVKWIGFWFNIPGFTLDPTQVTNEFLAGGADVIVSGIDTTEALIRVGQVAEAGDEVWAIPYDFEGACGNASEVCLGVPYFNWGPEYVDIIQSVADGSFESSFNWFGPDWDDITNEDTSGVGWVNGDGLSAEAAADLETFIEGLGSGDIELFVGPLNYQDGSTYLTDGEKATDVQLWYTEQLLEGIVGASSSE